LFLIFKENKQKKIGGGGNIGGKHLRGKFWREYFWANFWGIFFWGGFWGGNFGGKYIYIYFFGGGGAFRGKKSLCML
jgi:hypothetical protein